MRWTDALDRCEPIDGVPGNIVRNFIRIKGSWLRPTRSCLNKSVREPILSKHNTGSSNGENSIKPEKDKKKSIERRIF